MKNKIKTILCCVFSLLLFAACAESDSTESDTSKSDTESVAEESETESSYDGEKPDTTKSSYTSLLEVGSWGVCAKYCVKTEEYEDVPVSITEIVRGDEAAQLVLDFMTDNDAYEYTEADEDSEWVVARYELWLDDFTVDTSGTDKSVTAFVTGADGDTLTLNEEQYYATVITLVDDEYVYGGTVEGLLAFVLPDELDDYVIVVGEYDETNAYFLGQ